MPIDRQSSTDPTLRLSLELQSDGAQINGRLRDEHGNVWPFTSWLVLLTIIERLRVAVLAE